MRPTTRFKLLAEIGRGGMGVVYEALQVDLDRRVAIKFLNNSVHGPGLARFRREIEILCGVVHPNIVRFYDEGEFEGRRYFAMELVEGENASRLVQEAPFSLEKAAALLANVADALDHVHTLGVVHRDVKPLNMILTPADRLVLIDFGLAISQDATSHTAPGVIPGTLRYLAPECLIRGERGPAQDVYALALTFHELVTGRACYVTGDPATVFRRKIHEPPPSLEAELELVPSWVLELQDRALTPDPRSRLSARQYRDGLRRGFASRPRIRAGADRAPGPPVAATSNPGRRAAACAGMAVALSLLFALLHPDVPASRPVATSVSAPTPVAMWTVAARISGHVGPGWCAELVSNESVLAERRLAENAGAAVFPRAPPATSCRIRVRDTDGRVRAESPGVRTPELVRITSLSVVPADSDVLVDFELSRPAHVMVELVRGESGAVLASVRKTTACTKFQHSFGNLLPGSEYALNVTPFHDWGGLASYRFSTLGAQHARTIEQLVASDLRGNPAQLVLALEYLRSNPDRRMGGPLASLIGGGLEVPPDLSLRKLAAVAGALRSRELADRLHGLLDLPLDEETRVGIVRALGLARHSRAASAAYSAWHRIQGVAHRGALSAALAMTGGARACDHIAGSVGAGGDPAVLASYMVQADPARARACFRAWLALPGSHDRFVGATHGLADLGTEEDVETLRSVLTRDFPDLSRDRVIEALAAIGTVRARDAILRAFEANPRSSNLLWAVARLGIPAAASTLIRSLDEAKTTERRRQLCVAIGLVAESDRLEPLDRALSDTDPDVRDAAAWSLARLRAARSAVTRAGDHRLATTYEDAAWLSPSPGSVFPRAVTRDALPLQRELFPFVPYDRTGLVLRAGESVSIAVSASPELAVAISRSEWARRFGATGAVRPGSHESQETALFALIGGRYWKLGASPVRVVAPREGELLIMNSGALASLSASASRGPAGRVAGLRVER